jgi:hypothetical protein
LNERKIALIASSLRRRPQAGLAIIACLITSLATGIPAAAQKAPKIDCDKATSTPELDW